MPLEFPGDLRTSHHRLRRRIAGTLRSTAAVGHRLLDCTLIECVVFHTDALPATTLMARLCRVNLV